MEGGASPPQSDGDGFMDAEERGEGVPSNPPPPQSPEPMLSSKSTPQQSGVPSSTNTLPQVERRMFLNTLVNYHESENTLTVLMKTFHMKLGLR